MKWIRRAVVAGGVLGLIVYLSESGPVRAQRPRLRGPQPQVVTKTYDIDVTAAPEAKVRIKNAPPRFDQKGNLLKYSADELRELKGDSPEDKKLPGYKRDFADLKVGDVVAVSLVRPHPDAKDKDKPTWTAAGTLTGTIAGVSGGGKTLTVKINATELKTASAVPTVGNQTKVALDPNLVLASQIMILVESTRDDTPGNPVKQKKKQ